MLRRQKSPACLNWQFLFVGLFFIIMQCDARAVNVSNTWTMPQEGLNVFYRFFRDRISWFEADAVCQFHHANLVTVDNSFQFDATRDLLRELDVNDIVWIGLMRPQSSDRFMWSNSRPLVADTGYWAESLPLMDAPLCAVIDPIRDYRWHALRCGGPETASFLCEMPVPSWADACNLKDMPNLTLQYMADTASIELIRNCQEEGLLRTMCRGKQDRERAMQDLICPRERLEAQRINDITNSHFKSLQIINSIPSDNNENNDIELLPLEVNYGPHYPEELQTEKNTVQRLIEQFNVDELMQADEPSNMETVSNFYKIPGLIPKPVKKSGKKLPDLNTKSTGKDKILLEEIQKIKKPLNMDDIMMGDQPSMQGEPEMPEQLLNEEVSNEILEPLPHIKKTNIHKEDMEKMEKEAIAFKKNMLKSKEMETKKMLMKMASTTTTTTTTSTTTEQPKTTISPVILATTTEKPRESNTRKEDFFNREKEHDGSAIGTPSIGHPMHPSQQQQPQQQQQQQLNIRNFNSLNEEQHQQQQQQQHNNKEAADNSHFIPPMLLVKSHYVPPASNKHGHNIEHEHEHHIRTHYLDTTTEQQQHHQISNQTATDLNKTTMRTSTTVVTPTAQVLDLERPAIKALDTRSSSIKVIAEQQPAKETEKHKNFENLQNLHSKAIHATQTQTTATTLLSSSVSFKEDDNARDDNDATVVPKTKSNDETLENKNAIQELKPPQTLNADAETTATTELLATAAVEKSQKSLEKLYEWQTEIKENKQQKIEIIEPLTTTTTTTQAVELQTFQSKLTSQENTHEDDENAEIKIQTEEEEKENEERKEAGKLSVTQANEITTTTTTETAIAREAIQTETFKNKPDNGNDNENYNKPVLITNKQKQQQQKQVHVHEENEEEKEKAEEETIVKTTEILATHIATTPAAEHKENKEKEEEEEEEKEYVKPATVTTLTPIITTTNDNSKAPITTPATIAETTTISITTTTTVKPITTTTPAMTTLPQNEVKSTETSVSSTTRTTTTTTTSSSTSTTSASNSPTANTAPPVTTTDLVAAPITTTTTTTGTINDDTFSSTTFKTSQPAFTTLQKQLQTDRETDRDTDIATASQTNTATTERAAAAMSMEIATQTLTPPPSAPSSSPSPSSSSSSPPAPETTRNFLKSTTEMPFKPNRRRSLTKPETVSYMKKILG